MTSALAATIGVSTIRRPGITVARTPVSVPSAMTQPMVTSPVSTSAPSAYMWTVPRRRFLTAPQKNAPSRTRRPRTECPT